jgi:NitT/TauT family transport system substrate-binding protein
VPTNRSGLNVHFALSKGMFAAEGIDLTMCTIYGGPEISAAYDSGALKIGELGTPPGVTAIARGLRFKIIGGGLQQGPALFFVTPTSVTDWADLAGKTIGALSIGSCSYWYLRDLLQQHGLDADRDVTIRGLNEDYPRQMALFDGGEIWGLLTTEPNASLGEARGTLKCWGHVGQLADVPPLQWIIQVANDDFVRAEPELVRTVRAISRQGSAYLNDHPEEWARFAADFFDVPLTVAEAAVARERPLLAFDGGLDMVGLDAAVALQHRLGAIIDRPAAESLIAPGLRPEFARADTQAI